MKENRINKINKNYIISKSNSLVEASYKLTAGEQKLILLLASKVQPDDKAFFPYRFRVKEFIDLLEIKNKDKYNELGKVTKDLMQKVFRIRTEKSILTISWLSSAEYFKGEGIIELCFDPKLKPYLLELKNNYTGYRVRNILQLNSGYSIRIYEILKQYERIGERILTLEELRYLLGITENEYKLYGHFKDRVLLVAQKELKEKCDIYFDFEEIKLGRKVDKIRFKIFRNDKINIENIDLNTVKQEEVTEPNDRKDDFKKLLEMLPEIEKEKELTKKMIWHYLKSKDFDYVRSNIFYTTKKCKKTEGYLTYLKKALINDYGMIIRDTEQAINKVKENHRNIEKEEQNKKDIEADKLRQQKEKYRKAEEYINNLNDEEKELLKNKCIESMDEEKKKSPFFKTLLNSSLLDFVVEYLI